MACLADYERAMYPLVAQLRADHGLPPLRSSQPLTNAAHAHAADMAANDYFSHTSPNGRTFDQRIDDAGYPDDVWVGENIAAGNAAAEATFRQWVTSPPHRANLLSEHFTEMGVARAEGGRYGYVWVQTFGGADTAHAANCSAGSPPPPSVPKEPPPRHVRRRRRLRRLLRRRRNR